MLDTTVVFILLLPYVCSQDPAYNKPHVTNVAESELFLPCQKGYHKLEVFRQEDQAALKEMMVFKNVTNDAWVRIVRVKYVWLDNIEVDQSFYESPWSADQKCGLLHLRDEVTEVDVCTLNQMGYICGPLKKNCSKLNKDEKCVKSNGRSFIYRCVGRIGWKDAREICKAHGLDLGIVRGLFQNLGRSLYRVNKNCKKAWIGMHDNETWVLKNADRKKKLVKLNYTNWGEDQPSSSGYCAVSSYPTGFWMAVGCTQEAAKVCIPQNEATLTKFPPTQDLEKDESTAAPVTEGKTLPTTDNVTTKVSEGNGIRVYVQTGKELYSACPEGYHTLAVVSREDQDTLDDLMNKGHVTRDVWLPVVRVKYVWLDDIEMDKRFNDSPWDSNQICGLLHVEDKAIEVDSCQSDRIGYICGPQEKNCSYVNPPEQCISVNRRFFIYNCTGYISWDDARRYCKHHGLDLGIVRGLSKTLSRKIYRSNGPCRKAWIGLRKDEKWAIKNADSRNTLAPLMYKNWGHAEPLSGDCAVASFPEERWKTVDCTQTTAAIVCMPYTDQQRKEKAVAVAVTESKTISTTTAETSEGLYIVIVGTAVSSGVLFFMIIFGIIIICICKRVKNQRGHLYRTGKEVHLLS